MDPRITLQTSAQASVAEVGALSGCCRYRLRSAIWLVHSPLSQTTKTQQTTQHNTTQHSQEEGVQLQASQHLSMSRHSEDEDIMSMSSLEALAECLYPHVRRDVASAIASAAASHVASGAPTPSQPLTRHHSNDTLVSPPTPVRTRLIAEATGTQSARSPHSDLDEIDGDVSPSVSQSTSLEASQNLPNKTSNLNSNTNTSLSAPALISSAQNSPESSSTPSLPCILSEEVAALSDYRWLRMKKLNWVDPTGKHRVWEMCERTTRRGTLNAINKRRTQILKTLYQFPFCADSRPNSLLGKVDAVAIAAIQAHESVDQHSIIVVKQVRYFGRNRLAILILPTTHSCLIQAFVFLLPSSRCLCVSLVSPACWEYGTGASCRSG
jgi:hypothetical protein